MAVTTGGVMAVEWSLYVTAVLLAMCRFGVHIQKKTTMLLVSDIWLLIAVLDCTALIASDTATYRAGAMNIFDTAPEYVKKLRFFTIYLFDFGLYIPKFSMLAFYLRIIPPTSPRMRTALYAVIAFVTCSALSSFFGITFWCGTDLSVNWSSSEEQCDIFSVRPLAQMNWSLNFIAEVFIFLLPLPLIHSLQFHYKREKAALFCMFLLGLLTISASIARFIVQDKVTNSVPMYILVMTEYTVSLMIVSSISLRPLLRKLYRVATDSNHYISSPSSRNKRGTTEQHGGTISTPVSASWSKQRSVDRTIYTEGGVPAGYGSEVELTEMDMGRIYKTEEISVTSAKETVSDDTEADRSESVPQYMCP